MRLDRRIWHLAMLPLKCDQGHSHNLVINRIECTDGPCDHDAAMKISSRQTAVHQPSFEKRPYDCWMCSKGYINWAFLCAECCWWTELVTEERLLLATRPPCSKPFGSIGVTIQEFPYAPLLRHCAAPTIFGDTLHFGSSSTHLGLWDERNDCRKK